MLPWYPIPTLLLLLGAALQTGSLSQEPVELPALDIAVEASTLEAHVRYLASDELAGRQTGSEGSALAAKYLARVLSAQGVEPAVDGSFLQPVPLERRTLAAAPELAWIDAEGREHSAQAGVDFDVAAGSSSTALLPLDALEPEAAVSAPSSQRALFVRDRGELRRAQEQEQEQEQEDVAPPQRHGLLVQGGSTRPGQPWRAARSTALQRARAAEDEAAPVVRVRGELAQRMAAGEVRALRLTQHIERAPVREHNVVGLIRGVGLPDAPELADEVVVLTAHFDHIGTDERARERALASDAGEDVDVVFNGADDDASGVATVLEIAHALASGEAPARTILVLLVTGEELGLLGTWHYLDDPLLPLASTVANINFEMLGRPDPEAGGPGGLWLTGPERTNLMQAFMEAGLAILPDPRPEQNFFARSDNIAFAQRGIVAQTLSSYGMHADYHRVTDTADSLDYEHMRTAVQASLDAVRLLARGQVDPAWLPGGMPPQR